YAAIGSSWPRASPSTRSTSKHTALTAPDLLHVNADEEVARRSVRRGSGHPFQSKSLPILHARRNLHRDRLPPLRNHHTGIRPRAGLRRRQLDLRFIRTRRRLRGRRRSVSVRLL